MICSVLSYMQNNLFITDPPKTLPWRHNGLDSVSNHQHHHCLLSRLFGLRSKKISKLRVTGLCAWNSPGTGEFPAQMASYAENVSIWWRHHDLPHKHWTKWLIHDTSHHKDKWSQSLNDTCHAEYFTWEWKKNDLREFHGDEFNAVFSQKTRTRICLN